MTASDDAREVLAGHDGGCYEDGDCPKDCLPARLARTLLALTGEQAVEAAARALADEDGWDETDWRVNATSWRAGYRGRAEAVVAAALAAAEEATP